MGFGSVKDLLDLSPIYGEKNRSKKGAKGRPYFICGRKLGNFYPQLHRMDGAGLPCIVNR